MKKKRRLKKKAKIALYLIFIFVLLLIIYKSETGKVNNNDEVINFTVESGETYASLASTLKENKLIKSILFYRLLVKLSNPGPLRAGTYELRSNMNLKTLINTLENNSKAHQISITFKEGINFRDIVSLITNNSNITEDQIYSKLKDTIYLNKIIDEYWFLTNDIKQDNIYYSLEGYLFPDTYQFNKDSSIEDIFKTMLDNTEIKLHDYKDDFEKSNYSIHEIMTMASIVELEASNSDDRAGVAGVFYNRLKSGWSLGSDVTTYYGLKLSLSDRDLTQSELNEYNDYNTRSSKMAGKLPISPICIPSLESIKAAVNPENHNYYYFVADKNGKTYFSKTSSEHTAKVAKLKSEGLWYQY